MFQILQDTNFDFLGTRRIWVGISAVAIVLSLLSLAVRGINYGIEFTGGSEVQVQFADRPGVGAIRSNLASAGFPRAVVTTIGDPADQEVYIRIPLRSEDDRADVTAQVVEALQTDDARQKQASGLLDLNSADVAELSSFLLTVEGFTAESAEAAAEAVVERRTDGALFRTVGDLAATSGVTPEALRVLEARAFAGPFAVRSQAYIGPIIGKELVRKAIWAILGSSSCRPTASPDGPNSSTSTAPGPRPFRTASTTSWPPLSSTSFSGSILSHRQCPGPSRILSALSRYSLKTSSGNRTGKGRTSGLPTRKPSTASGPTSGFSRTLSTTSARMTKIPWSKKRPASSTGSIFPKPSPPKT